MKKMVVILHLSHQVRYDLQRNEDYIVSFDTYFFKENKKDSNGDTTKQAELEVFLTGSAYITKLYCSEYSLGS